MKQLKAGRKSLTFDVASVSVKTKAGRFLTGRITRQPFAKKICVEKKFTRKYQTYIQVTVAANLYGVKRWDHFVDMFREMIGAIMEFEPSLVVIPFPDSKDALKNKARPFTHEPSVLCSTWACKGYHQEKIYIAEGQPTTVKLFVGHDSVRAIFNSRELVQIADERDGTIRVCHIQASKVVAAGYLQGSTKSINEEHWTENLNALPRLNKLDVEVVIRNIDDPSGESNIIHP